MTSLLLPCVKTNIETGTSHEMQQNLLGVVACRGMPWHATHASRAPGRLAWDVPVNVAA